MMHRLIELATGVGLVAAGFLVLGLLIAFAEFFVYLGIAWMVLGLIAAAVEFVVTGTALVGIVVVLVGVFVTMGAIFMLDD